MNFDNSNEILRSVSTLIVVIVGIGLIGFLAYSIPVKEGWKPSDVTTLIASLTTFLGTVIGTVFGVQVGAAGKQKVEALARRALAALPPEDAIRVLQGRDDD